MRAFLVVAVGFVAVAAAAIALNLVLLGRTSSADGPVGKLSPVVPVKIVPRPARVRPAPAGERDD